MKIFSILTIALLIIFQSVGFAAKGTFSASGEYLMSDYDTPEIAEGIALDFAKQNAAEQAGIYLESYSRSIDSELDKDEIKTVASSKVEVLTKNITRQPQQGGRILLRADITATVDTSELDNFIAQERAQRQQEIQRYKELQAMNEKIKQDIADLQQKLSAIKDETKDDNILVEQERINREFLSKQKLIEFSDELKFHISDEGIDLTNLQKLLSDTNKIGAMINEAVKLDPKNSAAYSMRGGVFNGNDFAKKLPDYNKAIILNPNDAGVYIFRGNIYDKLKDYSRAAEDFSKAIELDPKNTWAFKQRGDLYLQNLNELERAVEDYSQIINLEPKDGFAYLSRGDAYAKLKNYSQAIKDYTEATNIAPQFIFTDHRPWAYAKRADIFMGQNQIDKARSDYDKAIALAKDIAKKSSNTFVKDLMNNEADLIAEKKEYMLKNTDKQSNKINADDIDALAARAGDYLQAEKYDKAIKDFDQIIKLDPKMDSAYYLRGFCYEKLNDYPHALKDYTKVLKLAPNDADNYYNRANLYVKLGEYDKAFTDYDKAIEISSDPSDKKKYLAEKLDALLARAEMYESQGKYDKALADYDEGIKLTSEDRWDTIYRDPERLKVFKEKYSNLKIKANPEDSESYVAKGKTYWEQKNFSEALEVLNHAIKLNPNSAAAYTWRGATYRYLKKIDEAMADLNRAVELDPQYEDAYFQRGMTRSDDFQGQVFDFGKVLEINPNNVSAWANRASAYERLGEYDKALADYDRAIELQPNGIWQNVRQRLFEKMPADYKINSPEFFMDRAASHYKKQNYALAIEDYTQALKLDPNNQSAYFNRALCYDGLGDNNSALADLNKLLELNPNFDSAAYYNRASAYKNLGDYDKAIADYTRVAENYSRAIETFNRALENYNRDPSITSGDGYTLTVSSAGFVTVHTGGFEIKPLDFVSLVDFGKLAQKNLGDCYKDLKNYSRAVEAYTQAINLAPNYQEAYFDRAWCYGELGDNEKALNDYNKLLELNPNYDSAAYYNRALAYNNLKQYDKAIADYSKALEIDPNNQDAYFNRGLMYIYTDKYDYALADYNKLLELNPNYAGNAYNNRGWIYEKLGNLNKALAEYDKALELDPNNELAKKNRHRVLNKVK